MMDALVLKNRSYRKFQGDYPVSKKLLKELVDLTRFTASASNKQPLKYLLSTNQDTPERNNTIFSLLSWAGYLKEWDGPTESQRPNAYIVIYQDREINPNPIVYMDIGIAAQTILLGAIEKSLGGCLVGSFSKTKMKSQVFGNNQDNLTPQLVIALGKPTEKVLLEEITTPSGDFQKEIEYYRDGNLVHHVPKRALSSILLDE